ncbi:hypothetical protein [Cupriavidus basilensis]|uniref:hypothetical protein n=1 Tax=Cupriavidus basilensis TaxID=68895 RepID=UPI000B08C7F6|nr:hypothetical protein [Cupriavidus basilensis]
MEKIFVCLTTISSRLASVHKVVESILSAKFDLIDYEVRLYISNYPYLLDKGCGEITDQLKNLVRKERGRFSIHYVDNSGPYRKILPIINHVYSLPPADFLGSLIVTADDDTLYPKDWLDGLYRCFKERKCVIGYRARSIVFDGNSPDKYRKWDKVIRVNPSIRNVLTGKDGVLYSPFHFHPKVRDVVSAVKYAPKADDLWLKAHTLVFGVGCFAINDALSDAFPSVEAGDPGPSLYESFNKRGGNDESVSRLNNYLVSNFGAGFFELCKNPRQYPGYMPIVSVT